MSEKDLSLHHRSAPTRPSAFPPVLAIETPWESRATRVCKNCVTSKGSYTFGSLPNQTGRPVRVSACLQKQADGTCPLIDGLSSIESPETSLS